MMAEYRITPIQVGSLWLYRGAFASKPDEYRQEEEFPILIFLLEGNGRKILVDTGGGDPESESMKSAGHAKSRRTPDQTPDQALRLLGVSPDEIDTVILTHLHWDHAYNNHLFPQARFVVQKAELLEAVDPLPKFRGFYESFSSGRIPPWARQATDWMIVDGACTLCEGIRRFHPCEPRFSDSVGCRRFRHQSGNRCDSLPFGCLPPERTDTIYTGTE